MIFIPKNKTFPKLFKSNKLLTVKSSAENHLIDFENNFHRRNVGQIEVNKYRRVSAITFQMEFCSKLS